MLRSLRSLLLLLALGVLGCANGSQLGQTSRGTGTSSGSSGSGGSGGSGAGGGASSSSSSSMSSTSSISSSGATGGAGSGGSDGGSCLDPNVVISGISMLPCGTTTAQATLTFDEPVTGLVANDTVTLSGGNVDSVTGGPTVYIASLSGLGSPGGHTLSVLPKGTTAEVDATCGTRLPYPVTQDVTFANGMPPTVMIGVSNPVACGATSTPVTLTFSQAVSGVVANDTVTVSGGVTLGPIQGGPTVYTAQVSGIMAGGSYGVSVLPVGSSSTILSVACPVQLAAPANAPFSEGMVSGSLSIAPGPTYSFGSVMLGATAEATFTVTPAGGSVSGIAPTIGAPFTWKGGTFPGVGGTCTTTIAAPCTVVVDYAPPGLCGDYGDLSLAYSGCSGNTSASTSLSGLGVGTGNPTTCATTGTLYVSGAGSDANAGTNPAAPLQTITHALAIAASGTEIHVAEGVYTETISVSGCKKLWGGYDATFALHDPKAHVTTLTGNVPNGAIISFPSAALHLDGFTVTNTATTGEALSYLQGSSVISNNVISGGDYGAYFFQHSCGAIHDNVLSGAQGGLYFWQSRVPIYNNVVTGTMNGVTCWQNEGLLFSNNDVSGGSAGIQTWQNQGMILDGNRFSGTSYGVDGWQSTGMVYRNNYVYGPSAALNESSDGVVVANNDLVGPGTGFSVGASSYVVVNNVFLGTAPGAIGIGGSMPSSIENNLFFGLGTFVSVTGQPPLSTAAAVNALDGTSLAGVPAGCIPNVSCWTARAGGNITTGLTPAQVFVSVAGADNMVSTLVDDDWHLATSDPTITQGGKDASQATCGPHQAPLTCGQVTDDFSGLPRTVPFSIGAHEK